jgi:SLOG in TRPM, prokaryote
MSKKMCGIDESFVVELDGGRHAQAVQVETIADLAWAVRKLELGCRAALVVVGGASGMSPRETHCLGPLFRDVLAPLAEQLGATVIDGGTNVGVMRLMGSARGQGGWHFPLIGVIVDELVNCSSASRAEAVDLEPNHTHFVLVPGSEWGEEAPWLADFATAVAASKGSATVLVNGGEIAMADVRHSIDVGRHVVALDGTGRTADALAAAARGERADDSVTALAASGIIHVVDSSDRNELAWLLDDLLSGRAVE